MNRKNTSWQKVNKWYGSVVGEKGHFFYQDIVLPNSLRLLKIESSDRVLDVACGQGVLARRLPKETKYLGIDASKSLIEEAKRMSKNSSQSFLVKDATLPFRVKERFNKAAIVLALQNIKEPEKVIKNISEVLDKDGLLLIVLNHPCFRIPRQSSWEEDKSNKLQYRRINRYLSPIEIPINTHPGQSDSPVTWSFHHPIEDYANYLFKNNFAILKIEEWKSNKKSEGKAASMENRAREEFPMFMAMMAIKL